MCWLFWVSWKLPLYFLIAIVSSKVMYSCYKCHKRLDDSDNTLWLSWLNAILSSVFFHRVINGGKSKWNEDQSRAGTFFVRSTDTNKNQLNGTLNSTSNNSLEDITEEANLVSETKIALKACYRSWHISLNQCYQGTSCTYFGSWNLQRLQYLLSSRFIVFR